MNCRRLITATAVLFAASVTAGSAAATIALSGRVGLQASAQAGVGPAAVDRPHGVSWAGLPRDLTTSAMATQAGGTQTVTAHGAIAANWASANAGSMSIQDYGWTVTAADPSTRLVSPSVMAGLDGPFDWSYRFTATRDGVFDFIIDLIGAGDDLRGLGAWDLNFAEGGAATETELLRGYAGAPTDEITASFSHDLLAGHTYAVGLRNLDAVSMSGVTPGASASAQEGGVAFWAISDAPEPSTWALAVGGFGLAGAAMRRRQSISGRRCEPSPRRTASTVQAGAAGSGNRGRARLTIRTTG